MLVTILDQKYRTGCERGIAEETISGILSKLNSIIEWDKVEFPKDQDGKEKRDMLGSNPVLSPGNCFLYEGNVIAVDRDDRLILIISETGRGALQRICNEIILKEYALKHHRNDVVNVEFKEIDPKSIPENYTGHAIPYYMMKTFLEKVAFGRFKPDACLECDVDFYIPFKAYICDWKMYLSSEEIEDDMIDVVQEEVLAWFYKNFERNLPPKPEVPDVSMYK